MLGKLRSQGRRILLSAAAVISSGAALTAGAVAQTTPLTTTTNQNSQINAAAAWTHPYWAVDTLCSDPTGCNPVIPILNPNQKSPLNSIYDYYAYSPPVTKFVDPLPTVPIAVPDQGRYPGSDYYELSVEDYKYSFHRDMFAAVVRGYQQTNASGNYVYMDAGGVTHTVPFNQLHANNFGYTGPQIVNMRNTPTRVKLTNNNSITGSAPHTYPDGSTGPSGLQLPVDETMTGAGSGPPVHLSTGSVAVHTTAAGLSGRYSYNGGATFTPAPYLHAALPLTNVRTTTNNPAVNYLSALPTAASLTNVYNSPTPVTLSWIPSTNAATPTFLLHSRTEPAGYTWGPTLGRPLDVLHPAITATITTARATSAPAGFATFTAFGTPYFRMNAAGNDCSTATGGAQPPSTTNVACTRFSYGTTATPANAIGVTFTAFASSCNVGGTNGLALRTQLVTKNVCSVLVTYAAGSLCGSVPTADQSAPGFTTVCPSGTATQTTATGWTINTPCTAATSNDCTAYTTAQVRARLGVAANSSCTNAAAAAIPGFCPSVTLNQYQSCATTPAIPNALRPAACGTISPSTFAQYQSCSAAMIAVPGTFACVAVPASVQYASCAAAGAYPGGSIPPATGALIACGNATLPQYTQCSAALTAANPLIGPACTTETYTQYAPCVANAANPFAPACSLVTWTGAAVCVDASGAAAPAGLIGQAGFACATTTWTTGDYCTTAQADLKLNPTNPYQCTAGDYSFDRALLHQHGGNTPWISDGTPHQWTTPVGDTTSPYKRGLSNFNVPDMDCAFNTSTNTNPTGCDGVNTYFYTNQNSARMMWYHDHSYGLTRLNVYNGELSLYMLTDAIEQAMLGSGATGTASIDNVFKAVGLSTDTQTPTVAGAISTYQPDNRFGNTLGTTLAIQDKTFVWGYDSNPLYGIAGTAIGATPASLTNPVTTYYKDTLWTSSCGKNPAATTETNPLATFAAGSYNIGPFGAKGPCPTDTGSLWYPHVYSSNTDPNTGATVSGGRWDFGPWVYPAATIYSQYLPTVSAVPESFLDTIVTNGKAYPYMNVPRKPMRFRIINASNERYLNLQLYYAVNNSGVASGVTSTGATNPFAFHVDPTTICNTGGNTDAAAPLGTTGLTTHNYANCTEVGMILQDGSQKTGAYLVPIPSYIKPPAPCSAAVQVGCAATSTGAPYAGTGQVYIPVNTGTWQHFGGVPDPTTQVPFIQIGNEGGFLPNPIVHYNQTVDIETDPRNITLTNVRNNPVANPPTCPGCVLPYPGYTLSMGPAERADIIIDFGSVPDGATLILYNDFIAPNPGYDQRYDLFTGDADMTAINGPRQTQQGQGPNTRTIMQFRVDGTISFPGANPTDPVTGKPSFNMPLPAGWVEEVNAYDGTWANPTSTAPLNLALNAAFKASHVDPIVSASATNTTIAGRTTPDGQRHYSDNTPYYMGAIDPPTYLDLTAAGVANGTAAATCDGSDVNLPGCGTSRLCTYGSNSVCTGGITEFPTCKLNTKNPLNGAIDNSKDPNYRKTCGFPVFTKAIAEDFDPPSGRLNALLGNESTSLEANGQQTYGFPMVEPITERLHEGETQIWQVIHNGVDTHTIHFHLMNLQVINRIDWAGIPKLPDAEERGWRELVKMQPLETVIVAVRMNRPGNNYDHPANNPPVPFAVPTNYRVSDVTSAMGETDPAANAGGQQLLLPFLPFGNGISTYTNAIEDFSWEYVWHCHLLGHEEADMMRPMVMQLDVNTPTGGVACQPIVPPPAGLQLGIN